MVSARSTVSMARTTPAQKPRGEQSTILRSGFAAIGAISGPNHPSPAGRERSIWIRTWDGFCAVSRHFLEHDPEKPALHLMRGAQRFFEKDQAQSRAWSTIR